MRIGFLRDQFDPQDTVSRFWQGVATELGTQGHHARLLEFARTRVKGRPYLGSDINTQEGKKILAQLDVLVTDAAMNPATLRVLANDG